MIKGVLTGGENNQRKEILDKLGYTEIYCLGNASDYCHNAFDSLRRFNLDKKISSLCTSLGIYDYSSFLSPLCLTENDLADSNSGDYFLEKYSLVRSFIDRNTSKDYSILPKEAILLQEKWEKEIPSDIGHVLMDESLVEKLAFSILNGCSYDKQKYNEDFFMSKPYDIIFILENPDTYQIKTDVQKRAFNLTNLLYREMGAEFVYPEIVQPEFQVDFIRDMLLRRNALVDSSPVVYVLGDSKHKVYKSTSAQ